MVVGFLGPDLSTPEATLKSFTAAVGEARLADAAACVHGSVYGPATDLVGKEIRGNPLTLSFEVGAFQRIYDDAKLTIHLHVERTGNQQPIADFPEETVRLYRDEDGWRIVSPDKVPWSR